MRASYLYEKEEMCPKACCGMPVSECTCGPDCEHCDCYEKNKAKNEGIEGMMPNTQVRGIMPKQRKPYHKHKIKSNHEPETDLSEERADPAIVKRFAGVSDSQRSYYVMKWAEEQGIPTDKAMELAGYEKGDYMGAGAYNWRYVGDEDMYESEEKNYVCVHAKKGKYSCKATSSYGAAKKAAEHWGLKSTAGIDAHLADEKKTATESMLRNVTKELTEAEFDEAAGEKDACYHKVKSRYKVWPSAYASGALVKCRKVGAANWGNKSKK